MPIAPARLAQPVTRRRRARIGGFGMLDAVLSLGLVAIGGVVAIWVSGSARQAARTQDMVQETTSLRQAIQTAYGTSITDGSANLYFDPNQIAQTKVVDARYYQNTSYGSTAFYNPWGQEMEISSLDYDSPGYGIYLGAMPTAACITLLDTLVGDPELTGLNYYSGTGAEQSGATLIGSPLKLTPDVINTACTGIGGQSDPAVYFSNFYNQPMATAIVYDPVTLPNGQVVPLNFTASRQGGPTGEGISIGFGASPQTTGSFGVDANGNPTVVLTSTGLGLTASSNGSGFSGINAAGQTDLGTATYGYNAVVNAPSGTSLSAFSITPTGISINDAGNNMAIITYITLYNPANPDEYFELPFTGSSDTTSANKPQTMTVSLAAVPSSVLQQLCPAPCTQIGITYAVSAYASGGTAATASVNGAVVTSYTKPLH